VDIAADQHFPLPFTPFLQITVHIIIIWQLIFVDLKRGKPLEMVTWEAECVDFFFMDWTFIL